MSDQFPSRSLDKIIIRVPDGMRDRIKRAADANGRSMNAELLVLLERAYPPEGSVEKHLQEIAKIIQASPADQNDAWGDVITKLLAFQKETR